MTDLEFLAQLKANYQKRLLDLSADGPKPSYSVDGQSFSWTEYQEYLTKKLNWIDQQINNAAPYEIVTTATT